MTQVITWNVQGGLGVDGVHSVKRLVDVVNGLGDADVLCFQEVAQNMPEVDGGLGSDQIAEIAEPFPGHEAVFGPAVDRAARERGRRRRFGNLILSRLPLLQVFLHPLPQPADPTAMHMPRQATEVVVDTGARRLRVITTHLEFHSQAQRIAQVSRLRALHEEACENVSRPGLDPDGGVYALAPRPRSALYCGDFNFTPGSSEYSHMLAAFRKGTVPLHDAWTARHDNRPHDPTCGLYDHQQWPGGAHCRDYFFVTADLTARIELLKVAMDTDASDHQPLLLVLKDT